MRRNAHSCRRLFPAFLALLTAGLGAAPAAGAPEAALMRSMTAMQRAMAAVRMSGAPDRDFAAMMIPHHAGAIAMAEVELQYGHDPVLLRLAQEIVVTQQQEIVVMRRALARRPAGPHSQPPATQLKKVVP